MDIVLGSSWTPEYRKLGQLTFFQNKVPYAKRHGYGTYYYQHDALLPTRQVTYDRVLGWRLAMDFLSPGDWFFFSGCDAMVTRPEFKLEQFILPGRDFMGVMLDYRIFGDAWFLRCCDQSKWMLDAMISNRLWGETEQEAFALYMSSRRLPEHKRDMPRNTFDEPFSAEVERQLCKNGMRMGVIRPDWKFVADDARIWGGKVPGADGIDWPDQFAWHPDTFMLHMGGKDLAFRLAEMPKYAPPNPGLCSA